MCNTQNCMAFAAHSPNLFKPVQHWRLLNTMNVATLMQVSKFWTMWLAPGLFGVIIWAFVAYVFVLSLLMSWKMSYVILFLRFFFSVKTR